MSEELKVGAVREAIEGLPDDAPAFVTVAGWDLPLLFAGYSAAIIDPPGAEKGDDGRYPTRPGLELWAAPTWTDAEGTETRVHVIEAVNRLLATSRTDMLGWTDFARVLGVQAKDWPRLVEQARSVAVRLDGELADLRRAIEAIHTPKSIPESTPDWPEVICAACRETFPCETRAFSDALNPVNALDEFADQPDPF